LSERKETERFREYQQRTETPERLMRQGMNRNGLTRFAAFVVALLLVLQPALASAAPPVQRDIFGNIICVEGSTGRSPARGDHDGGHVPDCCMLACAAAFQAAADLPAGIAWPAPKMAGDAASYPPLEAPTTQDRRTPANPRAPPAAA
jgi:hypothetical protein